ncbi:ABC transporter ATP-binding protein [Staphylococcus canis]|uniref:ABC transporter ATP-binding protein n=1 Tax=Staphylococcus canis TaxID=2724942 RepID=A0ABS0T6N2_9STAP|nr:ABC transporter ATP-binding protein [Staphylococcus canis]MBI5974393.1 ABC transporter ATP-binding protein [Staphylococcus canis]
MNNILEVNNLTMSFKKFKALKNVSFKISNHNQVIGLIGPNGAGKTTLINTILGQLKPTKGDIWANQEDIAFCPDVPIFEPYLTPIEVIQQTLELNGKKSRKYNPEIHTILESVGLKRYKNKLVGQFSRGMKQRLGIASSLVLEPKIIFLDEPTSALDPFGQRDILNLVRTISKDRIVIISSHNLSDIEKIAENLIVLSQGTLIYQGPVNEFVQNDKEYVYLTLSENENIEEVKAVFKNNDIKYNLTSDMNFQLKSSELQKIFLLLSKYPNIMKKIERDSLDLDEAFEKRVKQLIDSV